MLACVFQTNYKKDQACTSWWRLQAALLSSVNPPVAHTQMSPSHRTDRLLWRTMGRVRTSVASWRAGRLSLLYSEKCVKMTWRYSNQITYVFEWSRFDLVHLHGEKTTIPANILLRFMQLSVFMYIKLHKHTSYALWRCVQILLPCILDAFIIQLHKAQMPFGS